MNKIKDHWQSVAILITIICLLTTQIKNYTRLEASVQRTDQDFRAYVKSNDVVVAKFTTQIGKLTNAVTRSNTLLEIYLTKKGILKKEDITKF